MLEVFMYPVSGILKLWHLLFASFLDESMAWLVAIVFLVLTVRSFIAPLNWLSVRSGRISALMRPEAYAIRDRLNAATTVEEAVAALQDQKNYTSAISTTRSWAVYLFSSLCPSSSASTKLCCVPRASGRWTTSACSRLAMSRHFALRYSTACRLRTLPVTTVIS